MAKKYVQVITDDLGEDAELTEHETVRWSLDGRDYEFDTTPDKAAQFRERWDDVLEVSRLAGSGKPARGKSGPSPMSVRRWARANGFEVSQKGRIPGPVMRAYQKVHGQP